MSTSKCLRTHAISKSGEDDYELLTKLLRKAAKTVSILPDFAQHSLARLTRLNMGNMSSMIALPAFIKENTSVQHLDRGVWIHPSSKHASSSPYFIFYIHGGAYEIGNPGTHMLFMRHLSYRTQCSVFGAKYITDRGIDIMHAKLETALNEAVGSCSNMTPIFVGDSAGGALVMTFFHYMKTPTRGLRFLPTKNVLISPWVDLDFSDETNLPYDKSKQNLDFLPLPMVRRLATRICANSDCKANVKQLLLNNPDFCWPKTFVVVGGDEVLGNSIQETLAGIPLFNMKTYPKMKHVFPVLASFIERTSFNAINDIARFVRDDMVHVSAHVIAFRNLYGNKSVEYKNLECVCKIRICKDQCSALACDKYLTFQKNDKFEDSIHKWIPPNGMFYWMCPRTILSKTDFTVTMDVCFNDNAILIREFSINISSGYISKECSLPPGDMAIKVTFQDGSRKPWDIVSSIARCRADAVCEVKS